MVKIDIFDILKVLPNFADWYILIGAVVERGAVAVVEWIERLGYVAYGRGFGSWLGLTSHWRNLFQTSN